MKCCFGGYNIHHCKDGIANSGRQGMHRPLYCNQDVVRYRRGVSTHGWICSAVVFSVVVVLLYQVDYYYFAKNVSNDADDSSYNPTANNIVRTRGKYHPNNGKDDGADDKNETNNATILHNESHVPPLPNNNHSSMKKLDIDDMVDPKSMQVKVDVSHVIDFAIVGNPKTGTTFLMDWMRTHREILVPEEEMRAMLREKRGPGRSITNLYPLYKQQVPPQKLGYKCPADIREPVALRNLRDYFPKTKLIVGLRHPVWWFQSFYNYRIRHGFDMPPPMQSRGPCQAMHWKMCTYNAYFHLFLAQMGRTTLSSRVEKDLLRRYDADTLQPLPFNLTVLSPPTPHTVFLFDQSQIDGVEYPDIAESFRLDLSTYLEMTIPLPSLHEATHLTYATSDDNSTGTTAVIAFDATRDEKVIDICDSQFESLRDELVLIGRDAADWILEYFLPLPHVHVSSPDFFCEALRQYKTDPCREM